MARRGLTAIVAACLIACVATASAQESSWQPYTPTPPLKKMDMTVAVEFETVEAPGNEFLVRSGFFEPAKRRASEDLANMFARVLPKRDGTEEYVIRVRLRWDGELNPTLSVVEPRGGAVLATMSRPSSRQLRAVALNLQESMKLLKTDLAIAFDRLPSETREQTPTHRDPL